MSTMPLVRLEPAALPPRWEVRVPGSKSLTNRALLLAGVADGCSTVENGLVAEDTTVMLDAIKELGARVDSDDAGEWRITGIGGPPTGGGRIWCDMAGTAARFLVPMVAAGSGRFAIDAHPQLRRRPLSPLLDVLRQQGAVIELADRDHDGIPLTVVADGLRGGLLEVDGSISSQFISGLLMAAVLGRGDTQLRFTSVVSWPYLELTRETMAAFGASIELTRDGAEVSVGGYRAADYAVEPDASTASYFLALAAATGTTCRIPGLDRATSGQGDLELVRFLEAMGCTASQSGALELSGPRALGGIEVDMGNSSDVFMTLACLAPFASGPTTIEGVHHARVKECDRVAATAENLRRLQIRVEEGTDSLRIYPGTPRPAQLPTYDDHRIAMAFSVLGARASIVLEYPEVVDKSCPSFFELWRAAGPTVAFEAR
jgi:3-phosphoshikimate 1-carboxyvinyltransferase